jgi:hypothetical protein
MLAWWAVMTIMVVVMMVEMMAACESDTHKHKQGGKSFHDCLSLLIDESGENDITFDGIR